LQEQLKNEAESAASGLPTTEPERADELKSKFYAGLPDNLQGKNRNLFSVLQYEIE
jgi:hypothetical protein